MFAFHIVNHLNEAAEEVRCGGIRRLTKEDGRTGGLDNPTHRVYGERKPWAQDAA
jgi:hypothetical protein